MAYPKMVRTDPQARRPRPMTGPCPRVAWWPLLLWLLWLPVAASGPRETGDPFLRHYPAHEYGAFFQNWDLVQDRRGLIFAANNSGILEYDGHRWRVISTPSQAAVRALGVDPRGRVYAAGMGSAGFLEADSAEGTVFRPLDAQLKHDSGAALDVFALGFQGERPLFLESRRLSRLEPDGRRRSWEPQGAFAFCWTAGTRFFVRDTVRGLLELQGDQLVPLPGLEGRRDLRVASVLDWAATDGSRQLLLATVTQGLHLHDGRRLTPWPTALDARLGEWQVRQVLELSDGTLAVATLRAGVLRLSREGHLLDRVGASQGLPAESVRRVFQDAQGGLWLVLSKGLARLELPSPLTRFGRSRGLPDTVYACHRHAGTLYVGTDEGLFRMVEAPLEGVRFERVPGIDSAVWHLLSVGSRLLVAHTHGVGDVTPSGVRPVLEHPTPVYRLHAMARDPGLLLAATHSGLQILGRQGEHWVPQGAVPGVQAHIRTLVEAGDHTLWLGTFQQGILRVEGPIQRPTALRTYGTEAGLPGLNHAGIHHLGGALRVVTHQGMYRYRADQDRFEPDPAFQGLFPGGPRWLYGPVEDAQGWIWMHSSDERRGLDEAGAAVPGPDGRYQWVAQATARAAGSWIEAIYREADGVVWFCGPEGLLRLDRRVSKAYGTPWGPRLRAFRMSQESLVPLAPGWQVPYLQNHLRFEFALPNYDAEDSNRFRAYLDGHDREWSRWGAEAFREYTNLPEGRYLFRIQARDLYGNLSEEKAFPVRILPPWYRTPWAYGAGLLLLGGAGYLLIRLRLAALEAENRRLEAKVQERTAHLEKLNAIVASINENLAMDDLMAAIMRETQVIRGAERATVLSRTAAGGQFRFHIGRGWDPAPHLDLMLTAEEAEARYIRDAVELSPDIFLIHDFQDRPAQDRLGEAAHQAASLVMRIVIASQVEAYVVFDNRHNPKAFDQRDQDLLEGLRQHFVSALAKVRSMEDLKAAKAEVERANQRLNQLNEEKNRIIGVAAHDLRNPLSGIQLACTWLQEVAPADCQPDVARIQALGRGMNDLIQELLDVHAIEANAAETPQRTLMAAGPLLEALHSAFQTRAAAKGIDLRLEPEAVPDLWGDARHLHRVLENLLSNAVKYSPPGRRVWLRARMEGARVRLEVQDEGPGLTSEDQARVFAPYARLSARPTAGEPSVGLGLSIVKKLVEGMGGTLGVDSEPGQGACFWISLEANPPPSHDGVLVEHEAPRSLEP